MEIKEFHIIYWYELDELMQEYWELDSFESTLESSNNVAYPHMNIKKGKLDKYDIETLEEMKKANSCEYYSADVLIKELVNADKLPEGNYLLRVCW